jgi:hypothetical protein
MTDPISRLSRTLAVLRQGGKTRAEKTSARTSGNRAAATGTERQARGDKTEDLRADIARRLRAIDRNDPNRSGTAVRIFIERVLLHELGGQLERSPQFHSIVADVQQAMEQNADVRRELQAMVGELEGR